MVSGSKRCVIVSASPECDTELLKKNICGDDYIMCADGGADRLLSLEIIPNLIVGDFDSSKRCGEFESTDTIRLNTEKDDTDTMHCACEAVKRGFKEVVLLGALGGRLDHTLANLSVLLYLRDNDVSGAIIDTYNSVTVLKEGNNTLRNIKGRTVSVMPFGCGEAVLSYKGMYYPMVKTAVSVKYPFTISNIAVEDKAEIFVHSGTALLIVVNNF